MACARRAVIDIGSNSVRLVIFEGPPRAPIAVFNEKSLCGLGDREPETGALREGAMADALRILRRFAALLAEDDVASLFVFATAASREAPNGPEFLDEIRRIGFEPKLLSGEEEAHLAAFGILSGAPEVLSEEGGAIAGDMGGGSLELSRLDGALAGGVAEVVSLPLGGLRLSTLYEGRMDEAKQAVNAALGEVKWLRKSQPSAFYIVGGAWRAIGRIAMGRADHPIPILDHYTMQRAEMIDLCRFVEQQSVESLEGMDSVQKRRAPTLPFAALVLRKVLQKSGAPLVSVSSSGVREGALFAELSEQEREEDPLLLLCQHYAERLAPGDAVRRRQVYEFLSPLHEDETPRQARLRRAATKLTNIAGLFHPDTRGNEAAVSVLNMPFLSLDHPSRVALAAVLYQRHQSSPATFPPHLHTELIDEGDILWAQRTGLALRFVAEFDPIGSAILPHAGLRRDADRLTLLLPEAQAAFLGETPERRFEKLAAAYGLEPAVERI